MGSIDNEQHRQTASASKLDRRKDLSFLNGIKDLLRSPESQQQVRHQEDLLTSLLVMAWMVEARDPYTGGHLWRVSQFSQLLATRAGLPGADVARITVGAFLHDLGKISIPDHILGKKDRLTDEEYAVVRTHPDVGWRMLSSHPLARWPNRPFVRTMKRPTDGATPEAWLARTSRWMPESLAYAMHLTP